MARVHPGFIRQAEQLAADAFHQGGVVPARQIGPSDRSLEEHVPTQHGTGSNETHVARGMSRRVPHHNNGVAQPKLLPVLELVLRRGRPHEPQPEPQTLLGQLIVQGAIGGMQVNRCARGRVNLRDTEDVIEMRVSKPDRGDPPVSFGGGGKKAVHLLARVDQNRVLSLGRGEQVAVLRELAVQERDNLEPGGRCAQAASAAPESLRCLRYFSTAMAAVVASPTAVVT